MWSLEKPDWTCKIDEGLAGLTAVRWSPDGRHILSTADFQVCGSNRGNFLPLISDDLKKHMSS